MSTPVSNSDFSISGAALAGPTVATILALRLRCIGISSGLIAVSGDEYGADIIDIGQGRPGFDEIPDRVEE